MSNSDHLLVFDWFRTFPLNYSCDLIWTVGTFFKYYCSICSANCLEEFHITLLRRNVGIFGTWKTFFSYLFASEFFALKFVFQFIQQKWQTATLSAADQTATRSVRLTLLWWEFPSMFFKVKGVINSECSHSLIFVLFPE